MRRHEVEQMIKDAGLRLLSLKQNGHWKARVQRPDGSQTMTVFPLSTSDHRAIRNKRAHLRQIALGARGIGHVVPTPESA